MIEEGAPSQADADGVLPSSPTTNCGQVSPNALYGTSFATDKCVSTDLSVGTLVYDCVGYGVRLRLSTALGGKLNLRDEVEMKKRTLLALTAAIGGLPRTGKAIPI